MTSVTVMWGLMEAPSLERPHMDALARGGLICYRFFYAAGTRSCSPTRGTKYYASEHCTPDMEIFQLTLVICSKEEITLLTAIKRAGLYYHRALWLVAFRDLLTKKYQPKGRKTQRNDYLRKYYAPPWEHNYDESFVTESAASNMAILLSEKRYFNNPYYHK